MTQGGRFPPFIATSKSMWMSIFYITHQNKSKRIYPVILNIEACPAILEESNKLSNFYFSEKWP